MILHNNTILITGGSSGIGQEIARVLSENNKIIICGRSIEKLNATAYKIPGIITRQCDLSDENDCEQITKWLQKEHPDLNILINNAAIVHKFRFMEDDDAMKKLNQELKTNLVAPIRLIYNLLPVIKSNKHPAIINVTTGLVYVPRALYPFYNATKAALHSFTKVLRFQIKNEGIAIIEAMFPAVDTPFHNGQVPKIAIGVEKAVQQMIQGLENNQNEIRIGGVKILYALSRIFPGFAMKKLNEME
ncbi:MAG TPA: oxidoreductase [Cytophagales bacterium]|nr:oxidoreductase [Cytophagales bacterium]